MKIDYFITKNEDRVQLGEFTVLVGPNNTGKSQTLNDIHTIMESSAEESRTTTPAEGLEERVLPRPHQQPFFHRKQTEVLLSSRC